MIFDIKLQQIASFIVLNIPLGKVKNATQRVLPSLVS
jgi:hypothetical protein